MKRLIKFILGVLLWAVSGNPRALYADIKIEEAVSSGEIWIGATKERVRAVIGEPPFSFCIYQIRTKDGVYELWDFSSYKSRFCGNNWARSYALVFKNDTLIEIRTINSVHDLHLP